jgi:hypothetical protein
MKKVLFLASNPTGTPNLEINDEIRQARNSLQNSEFEIDTRQGVRYDDLLKALTQKVKPRIVHFSGHGSGFQGLVLEDDEGQSRLISNEVLADLFGIPSVYQSVECIVLNACFSEVQAKAIRKHINYVIGMDREVRDDAAIAFTKGFYEALANGESIENAFQFGKNAFKQELSSTNHRGAEVVKRESDTVDSVVQILKKDPPLVPFGNGSKPKPPPNPLPMIVRVIGVMLPVPVLVVLFFMVPYSSEPPKTCTKFILDRNRDVVWFCYNEIGGFQALMDGKLAEAKENFCNAYDRYPIAHSVDEICRKVLTPDRLKAFASADASQQQEIQKEILQEIVDQQWLMGIPTALKDELRSRLKQLQNPN